MLLSGKGHIMFKLFKRDSGRITTNPASASHQWSRATIHVYPVPFFDGTPAMNFQWKYTVDVNGSHHAGGSSLRTAYAAVTEALLLSEKLHHTDEPVQANFIPDVTIHQSAHDYHYMLVRERETRRRTRGY